MSRLDRPAIRAAIRRLQQLNDSDDADPQALCNACEALRRLLVPSNPDWTGGFSPDLYHLPSRQERKALPALWRALRRLTRELWGDLGARDALADALDAAAAALDGETALPTVWHHGGQSYAADGKAPVTVSLEGHRFLTAFLDRDESRATRELQHVGVNNPAVVAKKLAGIFGAAVRRPGPHNKGHGYFVRVRRISRRDS
jgi:hypothetical protein